MSDNTSFTIVIVAICITIAVMAVTVSTCLTSNHNAELRKNEIMAVESNDAVGSTYCGASTAPTNGLIVDGGD